MKERAAERGVRIAVETQAMGHDIVQLHPLDVGVLLELDEFLPRGEWFWDDMPAAKAAHASRSTKAVARYRIADVNVRPAEAARLLRLVEGDARLPEGVIRGDAHR